ncbi:MAG: Rha family transcriptional regulator [Lachnospiraceae bacterium]|jgi:Rha family phage regulatory protein|nr:Rha family transcriptional regulator [Lachnospiraceae bacterium]
MAELEQTLSSIEISDMIEKEHSKLLRDLRRYIEQFNEAKIGFVDFFKESTYKDAKGETRPCYRITKKGCEFIAHKLTGIKGTIFTARYINRFHEMQESLSKKKVEPELPWFIHRFRGKYIMLFRDFKLITGVEICGNYTAMERIDRLQGGLDYNAFGWYTTVNMKEFKKEYGFDYGPDKCMMYLYPHGIEKALEIYRRESGRKINQEAYDMIVDGLKAIESPKKKVAIKKHYVLPVHINITLRQEAM